MPLEYKELPYNSPRGQDYDLMPSDKVRITNLYQKEIVKTNTKILNKSSLRNVKIWLSCS